jgi:hypothetical protein
MAFEEFVRLDDRSVLEPIFTENAVYETIGPDAGVDAGATTTSHLAKPACGLTVSQCRIGAMRGLGTAERRFSIPV